MKRRIYWLMPDLASARRVMHDLVQARVDTAYDNLLLFEEHTWGPFESVTRPRSLHLRSA